MFLWRNRDRRGLRLAGPPPLPEFDPHLGFKCPGCGAGVYTSKRPLPIGQGQLAIVASCFCVTHFTPAVDGRKFEPVTLVRWVGFVEQVTAMAEEETPNRASTA